MRKVHYGFHGNIKKAENRPQVLSNSRGTGKTGKDPGGGALVTDCSKFEAAEDPDTEHIRESCEGKGILFLRL